MGYMFIWRKSIQKKKGHCPKCGCELIKSSGEPTDNVVMNEDEVNKKEMWLFCNGCRKKGKQFVVGTAKVMSNDEVSAMRMYDGLDFDKVKKVVNKEMKMKDKKYQTIEQLEQKIKQLEFQNGMLQGSLTQQKNVHDKEIAERDTRIKSLTKELQELEHRFDEMSKNIMFKESE